jgi:hypothetical protein
VLCEGRLDACGGTYGTGCIRSQYSVLPQGVRGRDHVKPGISNLHAAFPDLWVKIHEVIAEGEKVAIFRTIGGVQKGTWMGKIPPTGKEVEAAGISIYRIVNGKILEMVEVDDGLSWLYKMDALKMWKPAQ